MSNQPGHKTAGSVKQTAIVRFMANGSLDVKLSGVVGITARDLDNVAVAMEKELNKMRAVERNKDLQARLKAEAEAETKRKLAEEAAKAKTEEVQP